MSIFDSFEFSLTRNEWYNLVDTLSNLKDKEYINLLADLGIYHLTRSKDPNTRIFCLDLLGRIDRTLLDNSEKAYLIFDIICWHTLEKNEPGQLEVQLFAQHALSMIP